jgi:hypothetical protein
LKSDEAIRASAYGAVPQPDDYLVPAGTGCLRFLFAILTVNSARD